MVMCRRLYFDGCFFQGNTIFVCLCMWFTRWFVSWFHSKGDSDDVLSTGRKRAGSSSPQQMMRNIPEGLVFISLMNKNYRYFVPSTKNYFGGIKVSKVLCDSGCSSLLLPICSPDELDRIFELHGRTCTFTISESVGVGGVTLCLMVKSRGLSANMEVQLCCDVLGKNNSIMVDYLRFSLCSQDIADLLAKYSNYFSNVDLYRLSMEHEKSEEIKRIQAKYIWHEKEEDEEDVLSENDDDVVKRREYALLGQKIMRGLCCIKHMNCELYVDAALYILPISVEALESQMRDLRDQLHKRLPMDFNDWEDDDFVFQDDDTMTDTES